MVYDPANGQAYTQIKLIHIISAMEKKKSYCSSQKKY